MIEKLRNALPYLLPVTLIAFSYIFFSDGSIASAANATADYVTNSDAFNFGGDLASTSFPGKLKEIAGGLIATSWYIIAILTVVAGGMVIFGLEDGKKTLWTYMLGIGLAINFGKFILQTFMGYAPDTMSQATPITKVDLHLDGSANDDPFSYVAHIFQQVRENGTAYLTPIAIRMAIIFAAIDGSIKIALDLISGDKIKFLIQTLLKLGFYIFLITEWYDISSAVCSFFETIGYRAAGIPSAETDSQYGVQSNDIWNNGKRFFLMAWEGTDPEGDKDTWSQIKGAVSNPWRTLKRAMSPLTAICTLIIAFTTTIAILYTAVEMFIARIEFYLMSMIAIIMLPFGMIDQLAFLAKQTISGVFACAVKVMTIAFIASIDVMIMTAMIARLIEESGERLIGTNLPLLLSALLVAALMAYLTKQVPQLINNFLSGTTGLSGGGMIQQTKQAVGTAAKAGVAVATAGATAAGMAYGASGAVAGGMKMSQIGKSVLANKIAGSSLGQAFAKGATSMAGENAPISGDGGFWKGVNQAMGAHGQSLDQQIGKDSDEKKKGAKEDAYQQGQKTSAPVRAALAAMMNDKDNGKTYQPPTNTTNNYNTQNTKNDMKNIMGGNGDGKGTITPQTMAGNDNGNTASTASAKAPDVSGMIGKGTDKGGIIAPASAPATGSQGAIQNHTVGTAGTDKGGVIGLQPTGGLMTQGLVSPTISTSAPSSTPTYPSPAPSGGNSGGGSAGGSTSIGSAPSSAPASPSPSMPASNPTLSDVFKRRK